MLKKLFDVASSLKFRNTTYDFQKHLKQDISGINSSSDVLIFADKTNNIYKATPEQYKKLLKDSITKTYKKSSDLLEKSITMEAKHIAKKLELSNRIEHIARNATFIIITLKDHKQNSNSKLPCHIIKFSKANLGK